MGPLQRPLLSRVGALAALALATGACGGTPGPAEPAAPAPRPLPAPPGGLAWQTAGPFAFLRPAAGWTGERARKPRGATLVAHTGPPATAGITPQVGLGVGPDYPDSLRDALRLLKASNEGKYPNYRIVREGPVRIAGAAAYRLEGTYDAFTEERAQVRVVDVLAQTPGRTQASFFVRSAAGDFDRARLSEIVRSLRVR